MGRPNQARNNTRRLFNDQNGECFYCDTKMYLMENSTKASRKADRWHLATFDHIKLNSDGGTYAYVNGVCACFKCNNMRGSLPQAVFIENFDYIAAEWDKGNHNAAIRNGVLTCITSNRAKRLRQHKKTQGKRTGKGAFIIARFAGQIGKTVEDLFLEYVYNSTYELTREL